MLGNFWYKAYSCIWYNIIRNIFLIRGLKNEEGFIRI